MSCTELGPQTVTVHKGESKTLRVTVLDENRDPADLASAVLTFTVKKTVNDSYALITKSSTVVGEIDILLPTTNGQADITLTGTDTNALVPGDYVYDVWVELPPATRLPIIPPSLFEVLPGVTTF